MNMPQKQDIEKIIEKELFNEIKQKNNFIYSIQVSIIKLENSYFGDKSG